MRRRVLVAMMLLGTLVAADGVAAGGRAGLSVRGRFSGSDAAVAGGVFGGAARA